MSVSMNVTIGSGRKGYVVNIVGNLGDGEFTISQASNIFSKLSETKKEMSDDNFKMFIEWTHRVYKNETTWQDSSNEKDFVERIFVKIFSSKMRRMRIDFNDILRFVGFFYSQIVENSYKLGPPTFVNEKNKQVGLPRI